MRVVYNNRENGVEFSNMKEGTVFLYDGRPFMKVCGVTEDTVTEHGFYTIDLTCGDLHDFYSTDAGDDRYTVVEATLTIE